MFKLQSPSKYSPCDATHPLIETFFDYSKQFLNLSMLMLFSAFAIFCFTSSTSAKHFPLRNFFIPGNKKKDARSEIHCTGGWGMGVMPFFGQKLLNTQHTVWVGVLINHPS